jgi:peptidyl-dipeptidase Dcp
LTFNEVLTLFHEFGHGLHGMLANTTTQVYLELQYIDFVELPSQVMENWCYEPELWLCLQHIKRAKSYRWN